MPINVTIPEVGESIKEGFLAEWSKADGELVARDEPLLVLETDKITMNVNAAQAGRLTILVPAGATVQIGQTVGTIDTEVATAAAPAPAAKPARSAAPAAQAAAPPLAPPAGMAQAASKLEPVRGLSPAVQRMVLEHHLDPAAIAASGRDGRLTKADILRHLEAAPPAPPPAAPASAPDPAAATAGEPAAEPPAPPVFERQTRQPLSPLRQRIAERLIEVQQQAAILTTFNEADMSRVIDLRARWKDTFKERHGVGLGFMSFFVRASIDALRFVPQVNAYIDGDQLVTNHYYDIGIAVSTDRGLVVPVLRDADRLTFAEIERQIAELAARANARKLTLAELEGGTFTISNGGIYGSLLSTPLLNPPQSGILGMHAIQERPVALDGQVAIRPMMYLALSYDHRLIDGREAVHFLKVVKQYLEDPEGLLLEL